MYIYSLHVYTMITSNHDSGTCISIACTFIPWLDSGTCISIAFYTMITSNHDSGTCIYSLHVYTMITSNHDSGTCISIACTFIPWLLLIMIQVHVYL